MYVWFHMESEKNYRPFLWKAFRQTDFVFCIMKNFLRKLSLNRKKNYIWEGSGYNFRLDKPNYVCVEWVISFYFMPFGKRKSISLVSLLTNPEKVGFIELQISFLLVLFPFMFRHREKLGIYVLEKIAGNDRIFPEKFTFLYSTIMTFMKKCFLSH